MLNKKYNIDLSAKSLTYRLKQKVYSINDKDLKFLFKNFKRDNKNQARICLNYKKKDKLHQMIIIQSKRLKPEIKKHPYKDKSYFLLKGKQEILIYSKKKITRRIILDKKNSLVWIPRNTYHQNISKTSYSIHIETIQGPFMRNNDRVVI
jgi:cupin fold WbuC family metalloprotein